KTIPNLYDQLTSNTTAEQLVITTDIEGLKLPFEILPQRMTHISLLKPLARQISNIQIGPGPRLPFRQLLSSLLRDGGMLRVLLVASDAGGDLPNAGEELEVVKKSIQVGCDRINLKVEFKEIAASRAGVEIVETELLERRPYHIFHFVGHARHFLEDSSDSGLVLMGE